MRWVSLGVAVATVVWVIGSHNKTHGALASIVVLLLWLYLTSYIVLFGVEINFEAEHQTA